MSISFPIGQRILLLIFLMVMLEKVHTIVRDGGLRIYGSRSGIIQRRDEERIVEDQLKPLRNWRNRDRIRSKRNRYEKIMKSFHQKRIPFTGNDLIFPSESIDSCCPTIYEVIEPFAGRNRTGHLVELFQDGGVKQRFFETSCHPKILNKPCKFLENRHAKLSQCVQEHSFTYALVRQSHQIHDKQEWILDYVSIRSACNCKVINLHKTSKDKKRY